MTTSASAGFGLTHTLRADGRDPGCRDEASPPAVVTVTIALPTAYRVGADIRLDHPPSGATDCSANLLFDVDDRATTGYAVRLRERTGVPYVGLVRLEQGSERVLAESLHGLTLGADHRVDVFVDGIDFSVVVDGHQLLRGSDPRRLRGDHVGLRAAATTAALSGLVVVRSGDDPLPAAPVVAGASVPKDAGRGQPTRVTHGGTRIELVPLTWPGGAELGVELSVGVPDGSWSHPVPVGEWWLASGAHAQTVDLRGTANLSRVSFNAVTASGEGRTVLSGCAAGYRDVALTITYAGRYPTAELTATPQMSGRHTVLFHAFAGRSLEAVAEVVCGPMQHARMVRGPELLPASELTTPFALVQLATSVGAAPVTWGVAVPTADLVFDDEQVRDPDDQPFGLSLRGPDGDVQPTICLPFPGRRAETAPDNPLFARALLVLRHDDLAGTCRELVRAEYGYQPYREAVFGQSLTDTVLNLVDLLAIDPVADDSVDYQGTPSGWWSRAKNFIDIENVGTVRSTTAGVLLSAAYLTDDPELYERRARPLVEFHLSRNGYGWTPDPGRRVYGDTSRYQMCSTPVGLSAVGALHEMMRRRSPGIAAMAETSDAGVTHDYWLQPSPFMHPLHRYRLSGDRDALETACRLADDYIAAHVDILRTDPVDPHDFAVYYVADWIGLLELHQETGDDRYLRAAHQEAFRFATQTFIRPVPDGSVTLPSTPQIRDRQIELGRWWGPRALFAYAREDLPVERAEAWVASICGMTFEAVQTLRYSGPTMNPGWAAAMLRLSALVGDDLLADVAHNAMVGRFTSYPGYYFRQQNVTVMQPDFPLRGPFDSSTIYYHHAPGQLGMALDYLVTEHEVRSSGAVVFPAAFEENFVWFRFRTYGHRPGSFHGEPDVWLWMPRGIVSGDNPNLDWLSGERDGSSFFVSLVNASCSPQAGTVRFGDQVGLTDAGHPATLYSGDGASAVSVLRRRLHVVVPAHGQVGIALHDVGPLRVRLRDHDARPAAPAGSDSAYHFDDDTAVGAVRGLLLARPDGSGHDAFVQSTCATPAVLEYSLDTGSTWTCIVKAVHPAEWTVPMESGASLRYCVRSQGAVSDEARLEAPC